MGRKNNRRAKKRQNKLAKEEVNESKSNAAILMSERAANLKAKGDEESKKGDFDEAIKFYTQALLSSPYEYFVLSNRSFAYLQKGNFEQALKDAKSCIDINPDHPRGYFREGQAYFNMLKHDLARQSYETGIAKDGHNASLKDALAELDQVQKQLKAGISDNPDKDKFEIMCDWLRKGGSKFPQLYLQYYAVDSRGVHSLTRIRDNTMILYVPHSHIMTSEKAKASRIGKALIAHRAELRSQHSYLASYLCQEKRNPNSFWAPYINILPVKYSNMPVFFGERELKELEGSFTLPKIHDRKVSLRREYEEICRVVPEFRTYASHDDFVWARLVVITRIFGLMINDKKTDGLVPYADMLNHKIPRETKWTYDNSTQGFTIISLRSFYAGEEVFDSYGRKCNSRFFVNYGFSILGNKDNEVVIRVAIPLMDPHYDTKIRILGGRPEHANREYQFPANYREKKTKEAFSFLRFAHARDGELAAIDQNKLKEIDPLSVRNEIAVLKHLRQAAKIVLTGFPTTRDEDMVLLEQEKDMAIRNCIVMRLGEKEVLHWIIGLADRCIPLLETPAWKDLKQIAAKCNGSSDPTDQYINSVVVLLRRPNKIK